MIYTKSDKEFERIINQNLLDVKKSKIGISVRAWDSEKKYPAKALLSKIDLCHKFGVDNIAFFHFGGMIENNFFEEIER